MLVKKSEVELGCSVGPKLRHVHSEIPIESICLKAGRASVKNAPGTYKSATYKSATVPLVLIHTRCVPTTYLL